MPVSYPVPENPALNVLPSWIRSIFEPGPESALDLMPGGFAAGIVKRGALEKLGRRFLNKQIGIERWRREALDNLQRIKTSKMREIVDDYVKDVGPLGHLEVEELRNELIPSSREGVESLYRPLEKEVEERAEMMARRLWDAFDLQLLRNVPVEEAVERSAGYVEDTPVVSLDRLLEQHSGRGFDFPKAWRKRLP